MIIARLFILLLSISLSRCCVGLMQDTERNPVHFFLLENHTCLRRNPAVFSFCSCWGVLKLKTSVLCTSVNIFNGVVM